MSKFSEGDTVRCVNKGEWPLTNGRDYEVLGLSGGGVYVNVHNDIGTIGAYRWGRFEAVTDRVEAAPKFEAGQRVVCTNIDGRGRLDKGAVYKVISCRKGRVAVKMGSAICFFNEDCFEAIPQVTAAAAGVNPKDLVGATKVPMNLLPSAGRIYGAMALADGAEKYGPYNWRAEPVQMMTYLDAIERHLIALLDGEDNAEDSGVHHLGHIIGSASIILDAASVGKLVDNRPANKGAASELLAAMAKRIKDRKKA